MRHVLIQGIDTLLGSFVAARCLENPENELFFVPDPTQSLSERAVVDAVHHATLEIAGEETDSNRRHEIANRLHRFCIDVNASGPNVSRIDEVWCFADFRHSQSEAEIFRNLISTRVPFRVNDFNYVAFDCGNLRAAEQITCEEISQLCLLENIRHRVFHTSLIVGNRHRDLKKTSAAFLEFLSTLHLLKTEIEERSPQYFDYQALRCFAPGHAALNLIPATVASDLLLRIARSDGTLDSTFAIVNPQNTPFKSLCERVGIAYGMSILAVEDFKSLNAIDRLFHERSHSFRGYLLCDTPQMPSLDAYRAAGLTPENGLFDEEAQITFFELFRQNQDKAWATYKQRVADLPARLLEKTLLRNGSELRYYVGGEAGTAVILLNALGQGFECWQRLLIYLIQSYRVIIWEPRGTVSPPQPFLLTDHVDDLDAIVEREAIDACHLIGWCTGPKVAIDFYLRRPSVVRSMAFLNATFKCKGSPEELDSPYEQNMESLCRTLALKPAMAAMAMKNLQSGVEEDELDLLKEVDSEEVSIGVLSRMNADLKPHVLAPFKTGQTTLNYAHQLIDFWSHDSRPKANDVHIPVLLMGAEYDQVATPAASQFTARCFPNARHVHVRGATHYCLYDRPEFVANLLRTFFESPDDAPLTDCMQNDIARSR